MSSIRLFLPGLVVAILGLQSLHALTLTIDTGDDASAAPTIQVDGVNLVDGSDIFGGALYLPEGVVERLEDGTVLLRVAGSVEMESGDVLRGKGRFPVELLVGDNVTIGVGATVDFSAIGFEPGAGGGESVSGGEGGSPGSGGQPGTGGGRGVLGSGGVIFSPNTPIPLSITSPGTPAFAGGNGKTGTPGTVGKRGTAGSRGVAGFGALGTSGGNAGLESSDVAPLVLAPGAGEGSKGSPTQWPPVPYFGSNFLRDVAYNNTAVRNLYGLGAPVPSYNENLFMTDFYNGGDGTSGKTGTTQGLTNANGFGRLGSGADHLADLWSLSGGSSGGAGGGGAGGPGGEGGGGGGGGAGGQGEWAEPIPTSFIDFLVGQSGEGGSVFSTALTAGAIAADKLYEKIITEVVDAYLKKQGHNAVLNIFNVPTWDLGDFGGLGGKGAVGKPGSGGGGGGPGGQGGAGGGALRIRAAGEIVMAGTVTLAGGDGADGAPGGASEPLPQPTIQSGGGSGTRLPGFGMSTILSPFSAINEIAGDRSSGFGGSGGDSGQGGQGAPGYPGGKGGGGSGGTVILEGADLSLTGSLIIEGGNASSSDPDAGASGRIFLATNTEPAGTDTNSLLTGEGTTVTGTNVASTTRLGQLTANPYIAGSPETPLIIGLAGGAESFGQTTFRSDQVLVTDDGQTPPDSIAFLDVGQSGGRTLEQATVNDQVTGEQTVLGAFRVDRGPGAFSGVSPIPNFPDYPGYDLIVVFNNLASPLSDVIVGCNQQILDPGTGEIVPDPTTGAGAPFHAFTSGEGGWTRDPRFGGSGDVFPGDLGSQKLFVFLVPEDTPTTGLNFFVSAQDPANPGEFFVIEEELFQNGDVELVSFDAGAVPVTDSSWIGGSSGNWNDASNWSSLAFPTNNTGEAFHVDINLPGLTPVDVEQNVVVRIDRLEIGEMTNVNINEGQALTIEKFDAREGGGVILNDGIINLQGSASASELKFSGSSMVLDGTGTIMTTQDADNCICGIRPTDSVVQGPLHSLIANGDLGGDNLQFTNLGSITVRPPSTDPLTIDPVGGADRAAPGFVNESTLTALQGSELILRDGFFCNQNGGRIIFDGATSGGHQVLRLDDARLHSEGETFDLDGFGRKAIFNGTGEVANFNLAFRNNARVEFTDADYRFRESALTIPPDTLVDPTDFSVLGTDSALTVWTNAAIEGLVVDIDDPGNLRVCGEPFEDFENDIFKPAVFFPIKVEGSTAAWRNLTFNGNYCDDLDLALADFFTEIGFLFLSFYDDANYGVVPQDLVTTTVNTPELTLGGTIRNGGLIEFSHASGTDVFIEGRTLLQGSGAWQSPNSIYTARSAPQVPGATFNNFQIAGSDPLQAELLEVGEGQRIFNGDIDTGVEVTSDARSLSVDLEGNWLGGALRYDPDLFFTDAAIDRPAALEAVKRPLVLRNRGIVAPSQTFGGGLVDNSEGIIAIGETTFDFENVRVVGGTISEHHFKSMWIPEDFLLLMDSSDVTQLGVYNTEFIGVTLQSLAFTSDVGLVDLLEFFTADPFLAGQGIVYFNGANGPSDPSGTVFSPYDLKLRDCTLNLHAALPRCSLEGSLTLGQDVDLYIDQAILAGDFRFELAGTSNEIAINGLSGEPGSSFVFREGPVIQVNGLGGNSLFITNETTITGFPVEEEDPAMFLNAPGDANSPVGFINRGTIAPASGFSLEISAGNYDNEDGTINFGLPDVNDNYIFWDTLIEGGVIQNSDPDNFNGAIFPDDGFGGGGSPILRNLELRNIYLEDALLDNVTWVADTGAGLASEEFNQVFGLTTISGELTLRGDDDPDTVDFWIEDLPSVLNPATDRIRVAPDCVVAFSENAIFNYQDGFVGLINEGIVHFPDSVISNPLILTGDMVPGDTMVPDPEGDLGTFVQLCDFEGIEPTDQIPLSAATVFVSSGKFTTLPNGFSAELQFLETTLENDGGEIEAQVVGLYDALIRNIGGRISSDNVITIYNGIVIGGELEASSIEIIDQRPELFGGNVTAGPANGLESLTTLRDVDFNTFGLPIEIINANLLCLGQVNVNAGLQNGGRLSVGGDNSLCQVTELTGNGELSFLGGRLEVTDTGFITTGKVDGAGVIDAAGAVQLGGEVKPGFSPGTLEFVNDLLFSASTSLELEVGGSTPGTEHDQIIEAGTQALTLAGSLSLDVIDGFVPSSSQVFPVILSNQAITGSFLEGPSGTRIALKGGRGSFQIFYGAGSPHGPNQLVLTNFIPQSLFLVDDDASGDGSGLDWANAYTDLNAALALAGAGDEIRLAAGTYLPTSGTDRTVSFSIPDGVSLLGGFPGLDEFNEVPDAEVHQSVLSGNIGSPGDATDNSMHVVVGTNLSSDTIISGVTIRDGYADGDAASNGNSGGGMLLDGGAPTLDRVRFESNRAVGSFSSGIQADADAMGGGLYGINSDAILTECVFFQNQVLAGRLLSGDINIPNDGGDASGGGACFIGGAPILSNCVFEEQTLSARNGGSGQNGGNGINRGTGNPNGLDGGDGADGAQGGDGGDAFGGGLFLSNSMAQVQSCRFIGNATIAGRGGDGGQGGNGGRGGLGEDGGLFNNAGNGGDGGDGGDGGRGGRSGQAKGGGLYYTGSAVVEDCSFFANRCLAQVQGSPGDGGDGGDGRNGGDAVFEGDGGNGGNAGRGGRGGSAGQPGSTQGAGVFVQSGTADTSNGLCVGNQCDLGAGAGGVIAGGLGGLPGSRGLGGDGAGFSGDDGSNGSPNSSGSSGFGSAAVTALGGGLALSSSSITVVNYSFYENSAQTSGAAIYQTLSAPRLSNSLLWQNLPTPLGGSFTQTTNLVEATDPLLVSNPDSGDGDWLTLADNDYGDLRLQSGSLGLNSGTNSETPRAVDIDGNARVSGGIVDLGAYEVPKTFATEFPGLDPNGDDNGNGYSNLFEYLAGGDGSTSSLMPKLSNDAGTANFSHFTQINPSDFIVSYEKSDDLVFFEPMVEGVDYLLKPSIPLDAGREEVVLELLVEPTPGFPLFLRWRSEPVTP